VRFYDWMLMSPAYLHLTCQERAFLIEIARIYDGANNGRLALSTRTAAQRCHMAKDTATRAFAELQSLGFIECVTPGAFSRDRLSRAHQGKAKINARLCRIRGIRS
jgi:hypothetical protein